MPRLERPVRHPRPGRRVELGGVDDRGGQVAVVEQRRVGREAFLAHQLLGVEAAVGLTELRVPLSGDLPDAAVVRHCDLQTLPAVHTRTSDYRTALSAPHSI